MGAFRIENPNRLLVTSYPHATNIVSDTSLISLELNTADYITIYNLHLAMLHADY
jgi:hypothetical protein